MGEFKIYRFLNIDACHTLTPLFSLTASGYTRLPVDTDSDVVSSDAQIQGTSLTELAPVVQIPPSTATERSSAGPAPVPSQEAVPVQFHRGSQPFQPVQQQHHVGTAPKKNRVRAATIVSTIRVGFGGGTFGPSSVTAEEGCVITTFCDTKGGGD